MRKQLAALAALSALALPASAQASAIITFVDPDPVAIPDNNMFQSELNGLGLWTFASELATITLDADHVVRFEFLGSESGFNDTFSVAGVPGLSHTETSPHNPGENHFLAPILLGSAAFGAGTDFAGILNFTSSGGNPATVGTDGFAIFLPANFNGTSTLGIGDSFYIGFDDHDDVDDNHDDWIGRVTIGGAVPEPSTWLLMILGFGAIGFSLRQRNRTERIRFNFA